MGAIQIGIVISSFLFGITTLQAFFYYINYPKDALYLKCFVRAPPCGTIAYADSLLQSVVVW